MWRACRRMRGNFSTMPFTAERFVLFSSKDSVGGGPYIIEETYPLAGQKGGERRGEALNQAALS